MKLVICILIVLLAIVVVCIKLQLDNSEQFIVSAQGKFPKIIWTYWASIDNIPPIISKCIATWKNYSPDYTINLITSDNIKTFIDMSYEDLKAISWNDGPTRDSDIVRLNVLARHGGFWLDASIICTVSLDWIQMRPSDADFFGFYLKGWTNDSRYPVIENWMFACVVGSPFVTAWRDEFMRIGDYQSIQAYIDDVRKTVNIQGINAMPHYLAMHVAAQCVLQRNVVPFNLDLVDATDPVEGPLYYAAQNEWNSEKAVENMCLFKTPIIKLRSSERKIVEQDLKLVMSCNLLF